MNDKVDFIVSIADAAQAVSSESGLSYELMLAQAAQETGWCEKILLGTNNIFNIKADSSWIMTCIKRCSGTPPDIYKNFAVRRMMYV